jgi:hypothetical protein
MRRLLSGLSSTEGSLDNAEVRLRATGTIDDVPCAYLDEGSGRDATDGELADEGVADDKEIATGVLGVEFVAASVEELGARGVAKGAANPRRAVS